MNSKHIKTIACAAALCGGVTGFSQPTEENIDWNWAMGEGVTFGERPIVSAEVGLAFDSKFMSYGLVDNNEPILTPSASLTFADWITLNVESIFDITHYGRGAGYGNRAFEWQELDPGVALGHAFGPDDVSWLPTTVEFELGYMYEAHPKVVDDDTQFVTLSLGLPDLWLEPVFSYERDIDRDDGTYLNLELGHTFALLDGAEEGDDPELTLRVSAAQGWGDTCRIRAYLSDTNRMDEDGEYPELDHQGLMDTSLKCDLTWHVAKGVTVGGYLAYYDYLFDSETREASRRYEAHGSWEHSWNIVAGLSVSVSF